MTLPPSAAFIKSLTHPDIFSLAWIEKGFVGLFSNVQFSKDMPKCLCTYEILGVSVQINGFFACK